MAIRIGSPSSSSPVSLIAVGGVTLILLGSLFYLLLFKSGLFIKRTPVPPPAAVVDIQKTIIELQGAGGQTVDILEHEVFKNAVTFGGLPLQPPQPGRQNPFDHY